MLSWWISPAGSAPVVDYYMSKESACADVARFEATNKNYRHRLYILKPKARNCVITDSADEECLVTADEGKIERGTCVPKPNYIYAPIVEVK